MKFRVAVLAVLAAALLAGCADNRPPEEIVAERAQARWDALVAGDYAAARAYYTPGFRETSTAEEFAAEMSARPVKWTAAEVFEVTCESDAARCEARSRVRYSTPAVMPGVGPMKSVSGSTETWIQIDGDWWYTPES